MTPRPPIHWRVFAAAVLILLACAAVLGVRRFWPRLEPARSLPLLPPWPLSQPQIQAATTPTPLERLTAGWQASSLGNPAATRYSSCWQSLPRTPWDLIVFDGRLHLGLGNSSNEGPTANAGPVPLFSYRLATGRWQQEATLPEEEISRFVAHGRELWIPGADARGSWRWGNLYRRQPGTGLWWQQRRLPGFIHGHDLAMHKGRIVVAGNVPDAVSSGPRRDRHGSALATSSDAGQGWQVGWQVQRLQGWRSTVLLPVDGQLFAVDALPGPALRRWLDQGRRFQGFVPVHQWQADGRWRARPDITRTRLLPAVAGAEQRFAWAGQATPAGPAVAWIASLGRWHLDPPRREAFVAQRLRPGDIRVAPLPLPRGELAMDLQASGTGWLLLSSRQLDATHWQNRISRVQISAARLQQTSLVSFVTPLPAWSLAGDHQQIFVGLGHPPFQPEPSPSRCRPADRFSGTVLRLQRV